MNERQPAMVMRLEAGWLTVEEARERMGLSRGGIRGAMDGGVLAFDWITPSLRVIHADEVERYMREKRRSQVRRSK